MATVRDLRKRLKAVASTQKITKAMKMVSASKLKRAQDAILQARPFALRSSEMVEHILAHADLAGHPLLTGRMPQRVELVVLSSDRGLCGSFNSNIIRASERFITENAHKFDLEITTIGKKARDHFRRKGKQILADYEGVSQKPTFERAEEIADELIGRFNDGKSDAVYLIYNEFKSAISQKLVVIRLLPLTPLESWSDHPAAKVGELFAISRNRASLPGREVDLTVPSSEQEEWQPRPLEKFTEGFEHEFEPSRDEVLDELLPQYLAVQVWRAILESTAAEHGARMAAMDSASRNAKEMIDKLTLTMNRARQAAITKELMEIIGGAEALKG